jgi:hypothetical protein
MSAQARNALVSGGRMVFRSEIQKLDLLNETPSGTQTDLIALLTELTAKGHIILVTAVRSDHSDDSCLGLHSHADGFCIDCWPLLNASDPLSYADAESSQMTAFLADAARSNWLYQIGLGGSANTHANEVAAGRTVFADNGADHIHLGAR